jgi:dTDP-4-amino-4,6-dideoxygalactose transaminase
MDKIMKLAQKHNLKVIEDAAHALPTTFKEQLIGTIGDLTCFSFYATKTITTGEGGMIVTRNDEYANRIATMRLHGISRDVFDRYISADSDWYYEVIAPGYKYNMPDLAAAIGLHQLKKIDRFHQMRKRIAEQYNTEFADIDEIEIPYILNSNDIHSWHLYIIKLKLEYLRINRSEFIAEMKKRDIGTSVHFIPLHIQPYYEKRYGYQPEDFPNSYHVFQKVVSLPIYPSLRDADIKRVKSAVQEIVFKNRKKVVV